MSKPLIAVTMGDAAGVGPEVIAGCWPNAEVHELCRPFVVGHPAIIRRAVELWKLPIEVRPISSPEEARPTRTSIPVLQTCSDDVVAAPQCAVDARHGQAAYDCLVAAARFALDGRISALTTAPLHKAALHAAGHHYPGHTELLAELCDVRDFAMMLYLGPQASLRGASGLGVIHVTLHMALREVFAHLAPDAIVEKIHLAHDVMRQIKGDTPRIGVAALNPHAGEAELFGDEEPRIIAPAVARARAEGIDVAGPFPTDTLMVRARDGEFDAVVAMYHDQGHIALKLLGMHSAVNVTLGLPIVRTSVAHGTAFDLAWKCRAETSSMVEALRVAALLVDKRAMSKPHP